MNNDVIIHWGGVVGGGKTTCSQHDLMVQSLTNSLSHALLSSGPSALDLTVFFYMHVIA